MSPAHLASGAEPPPPEEAAGAVDEVIEKRIREEAPELTPLAGDEAFLRRAALVIAGRPPDPEELTVFVLDPSAEKRAQAIDRLVASDDYARNRARYWRESILARAQDRRARRVAGLLEDWLAERFAEDRPWSETVSELLTATGPISDEGRTGLIVAQMADPVALASESARLFLGIQIQCAQCHDHPYDRWKREQFHELAAFFPRVRIRRRQNAGSRDFEVVSTGPAGDGRGRAGPFADPERFLERRDADGDGKLVLGEVPEPARGLFRRALRRLDRDGDRALDLRELRGIRKLIRRGRGRAEHFMPDLDEPQSRGTRMQPVFFIGDGTPGEGVPDRERREALARYFTGAENPWFARAFVNRVWFEMVGRGFYEPIDDIGPDREVILEEALDLLARGFTESGYRPSWLVRTIARTRAFQRAGRERSETGGAPFAAVCMARLGAEPIYDSLVSALDLDPGAAGSAGRRPASRGRGGGGLRARFAALFENDPATPPEDITGTIPQALFLMNAPLIAERTSARGGVLAELLGKIEEDEDLVLELYLRTLAREPSTDELATCLGHVETTDSREDAFEDIFWCLLNSTEFLTRK